MLTAGLGLQILRQNGVPVGKYDFVNELMLPYGIEAPSWHVPVPALN